MSDSEELERVDRALDQCNAAQSPDRAQRILDSFLHTALVTEAVIHDADNAERSQRIQCVYWMSIARSLQLQIEAAK